MKCRTVYKYVILSAVITYAIVFFLWFALNTDNWEENPQVIVSTTIRVHKLTLHARNLGLRDIIAEQCDLACHAESRTSPFCSISDDNSYYPTPRFDFSWAPRAAGGRLHRVDAIFAAIGGRFYGTGGQDYVFLSVQQWRSFHTAQESRVFVIIDDMHANDTWVMSQAARHDAILVPRSHLMTQRWKRYLEVFYIQGFMHPGGSRTTGNKQFNQLVSERFFAVASLMEAHNLTDVIHLENDNMVYANMLDVVTAIARCGHGLASMVPSVDGFVPGVVYIRDSKSINHFCDYLNDFLSCGSAFGLAVARQVTGNRNLFANDMTYLMNYFQLFGSRYIGLLPSWIHMPGENCIVEASRSAGIAPYLFDAASFGQWYSFTELIGSDSPPTHIVKACISRFLDITARPFERLSWVMDDVGRRRPYWKGFAILSLHIHAKNLDRFLSATPNATQVG